MRLFHKGDHFCSGFQAKEPPSKPEVAREQEVAQTLLGPWKSLGLGEKKPSVAFRSKDALGLLFVPQGELIFQNAAPRS